MFVLKPGRFSLWRFCSREALAQSLGWGGKSSLGETGIYRWIHEFAIEYAKMYFCEKSLL